MTDPSPEQEDSTSWRNRLRRAWRAILEALRDAWCPPAEPFCEHGYADEYCEDPDCPHWAER